MRTVTAIFFLLLVACTQTPLGQLLKLPVLMEHFQKHNSIARVSFGAFLSDHYRTNHHDSDQSEDERLPFKTISPTNLMVAVVPDIAKWVSLDFGKPIKLFVHYFYTPQSHLCTIFHPPRVERWII